VANGLAIHIPYFIRT